MTWWGAGRRSRELPCRRWDAGIGLTEVAVAIVVLGVVLVGLFPLVVNSIQLAAQNAQVAQANRIVGAQLDAAKAELATMSCAAAGGPTTSPLTATLSGAEQALFTAQRTVACEAPRLARVTVSVTRIASPGSPAATATTKVVTK